MLKIASVLGFLVMVAALVGLWAIGALITPQPIAAAIQVLAVALMVWARLTFGGRSFHPSADPTGGGLVTTGPYHYIRHPIYTAACLFGWGAVFTHWSLQSAALGVLLLAGGLVRMLCEERLIMQVYPEYGKYSKMTKRMIPYVF
jgi:protein-S-isoprenylcysteine O-methyltransferase Ste14